MQRNKDRARGARVISLVLGLGGLGCSDPASEERPECGELCRQNSALLGLRETLKLVYNLTLQGKPAGAQEQATPCPLGGAAEVFGVATSNAVHGATEVDLTYELARCRYLQRDEDPPENYDLTLTGVVRQIGILAAQPTATTALILTSDALTLEGSVYDPPLSYAETDCRVELGQNGNLLSGTLCERVVGVDL